MKYHSEPLVPHKSALMQMPANLLAEDVCLPAAIIKKQAPGEQHYVDATLR